MFGDIGHGFLLFAFSSWLCLKKDDILKKFPSLTSLVTARYLLLLMGFFATFVGFIYNDMMSIPLNIFGSCYGRFPDSDDVVLLKDCVYPFGVDPQWYGTPKELSFLNSLKMKLAVIYGVT